MAVSLKTDLRFPESGQHGHGSRIIQSVQGTFKKEYEKLVYALTLSSDKEDNQTAIFLIFNSIDEKKGLSYNLMPSLKKLWEDPEIKEKYKNHKEAQQIFKCR